MIAREACCKCDTRLDFTTKQSKNHYKKNNYLHQTVSCVNKGNDIQR